MYFPLKPRKTFLFYNHAFKRSATYKQSHNIIFLITFLIIWKLYFARTYTYTVFQYIDKRCSLAGDRGQVIIREAFTL